MGIRNEARGANDRLPVEMPLGLAELASRARCQKFAKGALIIQEHDPGTSMFILVSGRVKAFSTDEDGREITFGVYEAGDYFGEMALDGGARSASVMALEHCECAPIDLDELLVCIQNDPAVAMALLRRVIARARAATAAARSLALYSAYKRLTHLFVDIAGTKKGNLPIEISDLSHQDIAARIGASREMVSRLLKDLERGGYVKTTVRKVVLLKKLPIKW
jgi:CRP/FNR family transcriptional regulator, cyclic AMP receptor protein